MAAVLNREKTVVQKSIQQYPLVNFLSFFSFSFFQRGWNSIVEYRKGVQMRGHLYYSHNNK